MTVLKQGDGYDAKYGIGDAQMFIIEGMDKVRDVIEKKSVYCNEKIFMSKTR